MRWRVGRVEGSAAFLLLWAWLLYCDADLALQGSAACLIHEFGHCMALWYCRNDIKLIYITAFGAQIIPKKTLSYRQEFFVAAAGPGINLLLSYFCCGILDMTSFAGGNLALAVFNLLPVYDLDGARMLRSMISGAGFPQAAYCLLVCLSFSFTVFLCTIGGVMAVQYRNVTLLLMCIWLLKRYGSEKTL